VRVAAPSPKPPPKRAAAESAHREEATAAGIYGIIISAAVMATAHTPSALATDMAVLVTLIIYWAAERYARIVAERIHQGHRPSWDTVRDQLTSGWEMITASFIPLAVLSVVRLAGTTLRTATIVALVCSTVLLCLAGWRVGQRGRLSRLEQLVSTLVAGAFGAAIIVLKTLLH
jgi:VIT1/CCC1 family predicted Fe2+/Mn2+ transporter